MDHEVLNDLIQSISAVATAIGVLVAAFQLRESRRQAVTAFEDSMSSAYRDIASQLPFKALINGDLSESELNEAMPAFIRYFDLSNEQAFLHSKKRVSDATWEIWSDGISSHMARPAFKRAWERVGDARSRFDFITALMARSETAKPAV